MARIRSIKPELLEDEKTGLLSHPAWRLFVSSILLADDYGNFRANPRLVAGSVFWGHQDVDIPALLRELGDTGLVRFYSVKGQRYAHICGWSEHQRVDKPGKPLCPGPEKAEPEEKRGSGEIPGERSGDSCDSRGIPGIPGLTGTGIRTEEKERDPPARDPGSPATEPDAPPHAAIGPPGAPTTDPPEVPLPPRLTFEAFDLESLMRVIQLDVRRDLGMWSPGKWAAKSFDQFFRNVAHPKRLEMVPEIKRRAERFFRSKAETVFTLERFLERWNSLAASPEKPKSTGGYPIL